MLPPKAGWLGVGTWRPSCPRGAVGPLSFLQKLLQAVAKYGEHDWFKIRAEVPGRSDAQCRDRYVRRLHFSLKKGRWNSKEEEKLIELIEKHGVGHWAKIASELPHRTGSQCLSKWKVLAGKRQSQQRRRRRPQRSARWSSSSSSGGSGGSGGSGESSSSSSSEDSGAELEEGPGVPGQGGALPPAAYVVPSMDLWVPARQGARELWVGRSASSALPPKAAPGSALAPGEDAGLAQAPSRACSAVLRGPRDPRSPDVHPARSEELEDEDGRRPPEVPLETVLQVLRTNTAAWRRRLVRARAGPVDRGAGGHEGDVVDPFLPAPVPVSLLAAVTTRPGPPPEETSLAESPKGPFYLQKEKLRPSHLPSAALASGADGSSAGPHLLRSRPPRILRRHRRQRHALRRRLLDRRLLMAMSPWVGDVSLPQAPASRRTAMAQTRADSIRTQLQGARLASTPAFALFTQLFQIDTEGCMEVIRERRAQPPAALQAGCRDPALPLQVPSSAQHTPGCVLRVPAREAAKKGASRKGGGGLGPAAEAAPRAPLTAPAGPRPKPKTVSELLREKRLREARARKATAGAVVLAPPVLLSSPLILPAPLLAAPQGPPATGLPGPGSPTPAHPSSASSSQEAETPAKEGSPPAPPALAPTKASAPSTSRDTAVGPESRGPDRTGHCQAPTAPRKQGLPEAPALLPAAPSPRQLPVQPLRLVQALGQHRGAALVTAPAPLPVTWVLTAQGLLPVSGPAIGGPPRPEQPAGAPRVGPSACARTPCPREPPADLVPVPPSKTDPADSPTEVDRDAASAPGGPSPPREATAPPPQPSTPSQARPPDGRPVEPPLHSGAGPGGAPGPLAGAGQPGGPLVLGSPPKPGPERRAPDLSLISPESAAAAQEWLRGRRGACVPPLGSRLPYQPPTLGSLRTLAGLLLLKKDLELQAAALAGPGEAASPEGALQAALGLVRGRLRDSTAYLLLQARFLAAFTLPALLATLPPRGVPTTLSAASGDPGSEDEDSPGELEAPNGAARQRGPPSGAGSPALPGVQGALDAGAGFAATCLEASDDLDVLQTRRSRHARKRRRLE